MSPDAMGWWYWFGMWVFGVACLVITWWLMLDAFRRKGSATKYTWPAVSVAGLLMQIPAFAVSSEIQESSTGLLSALVGIGGLVLVSIAAITHFSRSSGGGSTWSLRTRDEGSSSRSSTSDRRRTRAPQASVPVAPRSGSPVSRHAGPAPVGVETPKAPAIPASATSARVGAVATSARVGAVPASSGSDGRTIQSEAEPEVGAEVAPTPSSAGAAHTMFDEPAPTMADELGGTAFRSEATIVNEDDPAPTIIDDAATIAEDAEEPVNEPEAPQLVITDGKSSRIIITDRTGSFVVGRDPSKCTLAVDDARASRAHFSITAHDGAYYVQDLGSSNGTFVNGTLVHAERELADGDTVEFGRTVATFRMPS